MATPAPFKGFYVRAEEHLTMHYIRKESPHCNASEICKAVRDPAHYQHGADNKLFESPLCDLCQQFFLAEPFPRDKFKEKPTDPLADLVLALTRFIYEDLRQRKRRLAGMRRNGLIIARMLVSSPFDEQLWPGDQNDAYPAEIADLRARYKQIAAQALAKSQEPPSRPNPRLDLQRQCRALAKSQEPPPNPRLDMLRQCIATLIA